MLDLEAFGVPLGQWDKTKRLGQRWRWSATIAIHAALLAVPGRYLGTDSSSVMDWMCEVRSDMRGVWGIQYTRCSRTDTIPPPPP